MEQTDIKKGELTVEEFFKRFRIETRGQAQGAWGANTWMVVWDKEKQDYIRDPNGGRAYLKFNNTDWLLEYFTENETNILR